MVRFASNMYSQHHRFWLAVPAGGHVSIQLYVKHLEESVAARSLLAQLPAWTSPVAVVSFQSRRQF
jgi:hypothetical protein